MTTATTQATDSEDVEVGDGADFDVKRLFKRHMITVQGGRKYLPVSARIVWFRAIHPDWGIVTEPVEINHEKQYAVFRTTLFNADGRIMATGTKKEDVKGFGDWIEKAETGSLGRALALCGFGTQFEPELDEGHTRLADSPQRGQGETGDYEMPQRDSRPSPPPRQQPQARAPQDGDPFAGDMACAECGQSLTKGQFDLSVKKYDAPLCPQHQRTAQRAA